jgi:hypothetical protein
MPSSSPAVETALAALRTMLSADGYELELRDEGARVLVAEIKAGPDACADCLVPKDMMQVYFQKALSALGPQTPDVKLIYPADSAAASGR